MKEVDLFLEYKFRDFSNEELKKPSPTGIIAALEKLNTGRVKQIRLLDVFFGISLTSLPGKDVCPASSAAEVYLGRKIKEAVSSKPEIIWFDHLRFEGHWESAKADVSGLHPDCPDCRGKKREEIIFGLAKKARSLVPKGILTGYFTVPFMRDDFDGVVEAQLGQNQLHLGRIFDYVSPMLYHRMIGKPVTYISEFTNYLGSLGSSAKILPIIQLKDMPDELPDTLSLDEISEAVSEAVRPPSAGIAVFSWDQAIEKSKVGAVAEILGNINR